jgi:transcription termination factor NusB
MFFLDEEIPAKVSINEAIEVTKSFWDDSSKKIVNWVLNKIFVDYDILKEELKSWQINKKLEELEDFF